MNNFTKEDCRTLRTEMTEALKGIEKKHGIKLSVGNMSFTNTKVEIKVEATLVGEQGEDLNAKANFELYASSFGLSKSDYNREIKINGDLVKLVAIMPKRSKYPIVGQKADGRRFKFTEEGVLNAIKFEELLKVNK